MTSRSRCRVVACAAAVAALAGCSPSSGLKACSVDADCGAGATCQSGACQSGLALAIASPQDGFTTTGKAHVQVDVRGGEPGEVEILANDASLVKVPPPYAYDWDTAGFSDGTYALSARVVAGGRVYGTLSTTRVVVDHAPPAGPTVAVTSPTKASPVPVSGATDPGATVTVYEGSGVVAQVTASATGGWAATMDLAAGTHALAAGASDVAGNTTPASAMTAFTVVVDRSPPHVAAHVPGTGQANVWSRDPITVQFDEDMALPPAGGVVLVAVTPSANQVVIPTDLSLAGRTLIIRALSLPPVPSTVTLSLTGQVTDLAGNALDLTGASWSWDVPEWQDLGSVAPSSTYVRSGVLALSHAGAPAVANYLCDGFCDTYLSEWTGSAWIARPTLFGQAPSLDVDGDGHLAAAWIGYDGSYRPYVANASRWDGTKFVTTALSISASNQASAPSLRVDRAGNHVAAWLENEGGVQKLYAKMWDGAQWSQMGSGALNSPYGTSSASEPVVSVDSGGTPRVCWLETQGFYSYSWASDTKTWVFDVYVGADGSPNPLASSFSYRVSPARTPVRAYLESTSAVPPVALLKVQENRSSPGCTAQGWCVLGASVNGGALNVDAGPSAGGFALAFDANARPVVAWVEGSGSLWAKRWDGQAWVQLGTHSIVPAGYSVSSPAIAVTQDGIVAVSFFASANNGGPNKTGWVKRYNR